MLVGYLEEAEARIEEIIAQLHTVNPFAASRVDEARQMIWIVDVWHGAQLPTAPWLPAP